MATIKGIDISHYQKPEKTPYADYDFVIIKATEGSTYRDKVCLTHFENAKALGKEVGFYHFAHPELNNPEVEVANFVDYVAKVGGLGKGILALDWEAKALKCDIKWARKWLDLVFSITGIRPLFYCQKSYTVAKNLQPIREGNYGLWIAGYYKNTGLPDNRGCDPYDKRGKAIWQYTSNPIDKDIFYGSIEQFRKYYEVKK